MPRSSYTGRSQGDKVETSPSGAAKCQRCREKIEKGAKRVGKEAYFCKRNEWYYKFYHIECFKISFPGQDEPRCLDRRSLDVALDRESNRKPRATNPNRNVLRERWQLRAELSKLRSAFARWLKVAPYRIFPYAVLTELLLHMPTTKHEILKIKGIKEKRYQNFGEPILEVIQNYRLRQEREETTLLSLSTNPPYAAAVPPRVDTNKESAVLADEEDDEEEAVQIEGALSCDEIVSRKFAHAAANGYVISLE
jgi:hypothetical protein